MKIVITGSHFTPAQSVIEKLLTNPDIEMVYMGRKYAREGDSALSVEAKLLREVGIKFIPINAGRFNRFFSIYSLISLLKTPVGFIQSFYYLVKEQPDLIVSFGGFTGMPVVVCGWLLSVPSLIHEQSLKMGLANFISGIFADKIAVSFDNFKKPALINKNKFTLTGNPIRKEFLSPNPPSKKVKDFVAAANRRKKPVILVTAGNQGSHFVNLLIEDKLLELEKIAAVIHQTGDSKYDDYSTLEKNQSENYLVQKWIDAADISFLMDNADLIVSRAGINTLLEISLKSVPTLMIPIPVGSEQKTNARYFARNGLGEMLEEKLLTPGIFMEKVKYALEHTAPLKKAAGKAKSLVIMDADKRLVQEILLILNKRLNLMDA